MAFCNPSIPTEYKGLSRNATSIFGKTGTNPSVILNGVNRETLGDRLSRVLKERGLSQSEIARMAGVTPQAIQYICAEKAERSAYVAEIAHALNLSTWWLATGQGHRALWREMSYEARLVGSEYERLPPDGKREMRLHLDYLLKRFPTDIEPSLTLAKDC